MAAIPDATKSSSRTDSVDIDRIKTECSAMLRLLKTLEKEEQGISAQNEILAREALLCGFEPHLLEPPAPKRRKHLLQKQYMQNNDTEAGGNTD
jgi:hypothetical protein